MKFKYVRIQGKELAENTLYAKGIFNASVRKTLCFSSRPGTLS